MWLDEDGGANGGGGDDGGMRLDDDGGIGGGGGGGGGGDDSSGGNDGGGGGGGGGGGCGGGGTRSESEGWVAFLLSIGQLSANDIIKRLSIKDLSTAREACARVQKSIDSALNRAKPKAHAVPNTAASFRALRDGLHTIAATIKRYNIQLQSRRQRRDLPTDGLRKGAAKLLARAHNISSVLIALSASLNDPSCSWSAASLDRLLHPSAGAPVTATRDDPDVIAVVLIDAFNRYERSREEYGFAKDSVEDAIAGLEHVIGQQTERLADINKATSRGAKVEDVVRVFDCFRSLFVSIGAGKLFAFGDTTSPALHYLAQHLNRGRLVNEERVVHLRRLLAGLNALGEAVPVLRADTLDRAYLGRFGPQLLSGEMTAEQWAKRVCAGDARGAARMEVAREDAGEAAGGGDVDDDAGDRDDCSEGADSCASAAADAEEELVDADDAGLDHAFDRYDADQFQAVAGLAAMAAGEMRGEGESPPEGFFELAADAV
jgi:hypothetical protein